MAGPDRKKRRGNAVIAMAFTVVAAGMVGLSFAAVPLYRMFCAVTGYGGTPQIGESVAPGGDGQTIRVRFNADVNPGLPWKFGPDKLEVTLPLGEEQLAFYHATNNSASPITGVALYTVTPDKAAKYFHKTACFCFNKQTLEPHQSMEFPVTYWVDPKIASDPATQDVKVVTLSYTFFRSLDDAAKSGTLEKAGPHIGSKAATSPRTAEQTN
ncbi:MAG: cytochrome c oxidase assembly protein [Acetobacteraceae bacterium]